MPHRLCTNKNLIYHLSFITRYFIRCVWLYTCHLQCTQSRHTAYCRWYAWVCSLWNNLLKMESNQFIRYESLDMSHSKLNTYKCGGFVPMTERKMHSKPNTFPNTRTAITENYISELLIILNAPDYLTVLFWRYNSVAIFYFKPCHFMHFKQTNFGVMRYNLQYIKIHGKLNSRGGSFLQALWMFSVWPCSAIKNISKRKIKWQQEVRSENHFQTEKP